MKKSDEWTIENKLKWKIGTHHNWKKKNLEAVLELTAKQHCQFSLFNAKMGQMGWIGSAVYLVTPKRPPWFWIFQLPWMPIIHLSSFLLIVYWVPQFFMHNKSILNEVIYCQIHKTDLKFWAFLAVRAVAEKNVNFGLKTIHPFMP